MLATHPELALEEAQRIKLQAILATAERRPPTAGRRAQKQSASHSPTTDRDSTFHIDSLSDTMAEVSMRMRAFVCMSCAACVSTCSLVHCSMTDVFLIAIHRKRPRHVDAPYLAKSRAYPATIPCDPRLPGLPRMLPPLASFSIR
jgi:ferredoxin